MTINRKPKLVVMLSRFPFPLEKGDKLRAYYQIKELSAIYDISLICISELQPTEEHNRELKKYCSKIIIHVLPKWRSWLSSFIGLFTSKPLQIAYFHTSAIQRKISKELNTLKPDHIYCQLIRVAEYVKNYHDCPKTLDYMDAFSTGIERRVALEPFYIKWLFKLESKRLTEYERHIYDYFEAHTIISEQDKNLLGTLPSQKIICVKNGVSDVFFEKNQEWQPTKDLVFVGNLNYPPNVEAVKFIINEILPLSDHYKLKLKFLAAGAEPSKSLLNLEYKVENFEIYSNPKDIRKAYLSGKVFVAPMKIGTGLQNKLLESMALGIPSITTKLANNALNAEPDISILIAETADEFIQQFISLQDATRFESISKNGQNYIKENFVWSKVTQPLIEAIKNA